MEKKLKVKRDALLFEKMSGKYKCPHYIPPSAMAEMLTNLNVTADFEAKKLIAEVAENFAMELVKDFRSKSITVECIRQRVKTFELL